jgi:anti-sigma regulatory factor (Ser/Thr protein kinase)
MRDVEAQLIHDMQNTAMVLREASGQLHQNRETLPPGVVAHLTEMLARRSDMLVRLLGDLSTAHLAERGELDLSLQPVSLKDVCRELLEERQPALGGRITADVAADAVVVADPLRITQVLDNLVTNALRYGGPNVHVSAARDGEHVRLTVTDDGPGIPDHLVDTLFNAYVRGTASHHVGGSGLGLLIVRQLCQAMSGTVEYDNTTDTRFTATFPALPAPSRELDPDVAQSGRHSVAFWHTEENLAESLVAYVAHGLAAGEAVLVAATPAHHRLLEAGLVAVGIDPAAVSASGQYLPLDADALHTDLPRLHHIDHERFDSLIGRTAEHVSSRWHKFRVFGEIVDLYWRRDDDHLALELEACWNALRARLPFPLLCAYELAPGESAGAICDCHDTVVSA